MFKVNNKDLNIFHTLFLLLTLNMSLPAGEPIFRVHWNLHGKKDIQLHEHLTSSQRNAKIHLEKMTLTYRKSTLHCAKNEVFH